MAGVEGVTWQACLFNITRATEFTNDDVDQYSALIDLGYECTGVAIFVPTIDNATVSVYAQRDNSIATVPTVVHNMKSDTLSTQAWATTAGTGGIFIHCPVLGGVRYIRLKTSANQTANRTFYVLGTV